MKTFFLFAAIFLARCSGGQCSPTHACGSDDMCVYKIGSCSATGECVARPTGPQCNAITVRCGCGENVTTGCGFPDGYASGPSDGATTCAPMR